MLNEIFVKWLTRYQRAKYPIYLGGGNCYFVRVQEPDLANSYRVTIERRLTSSIFQDRLHRICFTVVSAYIL